MERKIWILLGLIQIYFICNSATYTPKLCIQRQYNHTSIVCVCNATYCDETPPVKRLPKGQYVAHCSDMGGARFFKRTGKMKREKPFWAHARITVDRNRQFQKIVGFGGAFTDATGVNLNSLSRATRLNVIKAYFSAIGLEYNMGRVPIGGSDFSVTPYTYNEEPKNDANLINFQLRREDYELKIPFIEEAMKYCRQLFLVASAWTAPKWMKTNNTYIGGRVQKKYYQTWADYHLKFFEEYDNYDINFWGVTLGNEPTNMIVPLVNFNALEWDPRSQATWLAQNLGPTLRNSPFSDIKIIALDDQRYHLPWWILSMSQINKAVDYIDGVGTHWYYDDFVAVELVDAMHSIFPNKFLINTEACIGAEDYIIEKVAPGDWERGEMYMNNVLELMNHHYVGWIDWNLVLNRDGGPNWVRNHVDATIIALPESDEFFKQPTYYALGHFSKFVPRDSVRIHMDNSFGGVSASAFLRPDNGVAVVFYNPTNWATTVTIYEKNKGYIDIWMTPRSFHSVVYWA